MRIHHSAARMRTFIDVRMRRDELRTPMLYNLASELRRHRVTIRELKADMDVTLTRIREIRAMARVPFLIALDYQEAIERIAAGRGNARIL